MQVAVRAAGGDGSCKKLMRSLYRLAAIQILERFQELFVEAVCEGLRSLGVKPLASSASTRELPVARSSSALRHKAPGACAERDMEVQISVRCMWGALRALLHRAVTLSLSPGEPVKLVASAVLVRGSLEVMRRESKHHSKGDALPKSWALAPCVFVWPEFAPGVPHGKVPMRAGPEGAVLVVVDPSREQHARSQVRRFCTCVKLCSVR
jgi:hypothetical protein